MDIDELEPVKTPTYAIGSDLSKLSVDELRGLVETLKEEIERIEKSAAEKEAKRSEADNFFKS